MNKIEQGSVWCSTCGILYIWSRCTVVWTFCHRILVTFPTIMHDELRLCQQDAMGDFSHWKSETETVSWCFHARDPFGQRALAISPRLFSHSVGFNQFRWNGLVPALSLYTLSQNIRTLEVRCAVLGGVCYVQIMVMWQMDSSFLYPWDLLCIGILLQFAMDAMDAMASWKMIYLVWMDQILHQLVSVANGINHLPFGSIWCRILMFRFAHCEIHHIFMSFFAQKVFPFPVGGLSLIYTWMIFLFEK